MWRKNTRWRFIFLSPANNFLYFSFKPWKWINKNPLRPSGKSFHPHTGMSQALDVYALRFLITVFHRAIFVELIWVNGIITPAWKYSLHAKSHHLGWIIGIIRTITYDIAPLFHQIPEIFSKRWEILVLRMTAPNVLFHHFALPS